MIVFAPEDVLLNMILKLKNEKNMKQKLLTLWNDCNAKRELILAEKNEGCLNGLMVLKNQFLTFAANEITDIMNELAKTIEDEYTTTEDTQKSNNPVR